MLTDHQLKPLLRAMKRNSCVLFLGAGFSSDALDSIGRPLPSGTTLARRIWTWLGYEDKHGPFPSTTKLSMLADSAVRKRGQAAWIQFLQRNLSARSYPAWYSTIPNIYWKRIYTTNADDLVEMVYRAARFPRLHTINARQEGYQDLDPLLDAVQYVKLNGTAHGASPTVTFSVRDYALRSSEHDPWYDHFVRDYMGHATILIGTQLDEPPFWHAVESRSGRMGAATEQRRRSFLVSPTIDPVTVDALAEFNVVPVMATGQAFFEFINQAFGRYPDRDEVLALARPQLARAYRSNKDIADLVQVFSPVRVIDAPAHYRSHFLLGAMPTWQDIALGLDARREVNKEAFELIDMHLTEKQGLDPVVILGHRGSGKSTLLMRTSVDLVAAGHTVFWGSGEDLPAPHILAKAIDALLGRVLLCVDDSEWFAANLDRYLAELRNCRIPPVIALALRANQAHFLEDIGDFEAHEVWIGNLSNADINAVIDVLERENLLGTVTGQPRSAIEAAFRVKSQRQLLVAMREVTTGKKFDEILKQEYMDIEDPEYRVIYLTACLATDQSASITEDQLVAASNLPPAKLLSGLQRELRQLLVRIDTSSESRIVARHQAIAEVVVDHLARRRELSSAYKRLLNVLANDMNRRARIGPGRRYFRLFKRILNHQAIYRRFRQDIDSARAIFQSLVKRFPDDSHFWLQYGLLELEFGELDFAEHYVASAVSLSPRDRMIQNAHGHLLLARGIAAPNAAQANTFRENGELILRKLMEEWENPYPWHTYCSHMLRWLNLWEPDRIRRRTGLEKLKDLCDEACEAFPRDDRLRVLREQIIEAYLMMAT